MKAKKKKSRQAKNKGIQSCQDHAFAIQLSSGSCEKRNGIGDMESKERSEAKTDIWLYYILREESSQLAKECVE